MTKKISRNTQLMRECSRIKLSQMPSAQCNTYLKDKLSQKYHKNIQFNCQDCAIIALYDDNGYITDEELIKCTGLRHM